MLDSEKSRFDGLTNQLGIKDRTEHDVWMRQDQNRCEPSLEMYLQDVK